MAVIPEGVVTSSVRTARVLNQSGALAAAIPDLVDNTGGVAGAAIPAVPALVVVPVAGAEADRAEVNATTLPAIRDGFASVNAKLDAILAALRGVGGIAP